MKLKIFDEQIDLNAQVSDVKSLSQVSSGNTKSSGMNKFNLLADIKEDQEISGASN
jgi:hypothetical protein